MSSFRKIELAGWPRRPAYEFFRDFDLPFWNVTVPVEVGPLRRWCQRTGHGFFPASLWLCTRAANEVPELRQRLRPDGVIEWDELYAGSTVLHDDHTFTFCYFDYDPDPDVFCRKAKRRLEAHRAGKVFAPRDEADDLIHFSVLPWLSFTGFQHARRLGRDDSVPKIVLGKFEARDGRTCMPVSIEVHHALVDGYHVGQFFERMAALQAAL